MTGDWPGSSAGGIELAGRIGRGTFEADVVLHVAPGEVHAVLGPNGAGKSTLVRTVAGLDPLRSGALRLAGHVVDDARTFVPPERRRVGTMFQDDRLFRHLSVLANVAFGPRVQGARRSAALAAARARLDQLGVADLAGRRPADLSGGQARRVALARTLAASPRALVLDEPLAALDMPARREVREVLAGELARFGGPCLLVTHDLADAVALADRLTVLEAGVVVQSGTLDELVAAPASDYVARVTSGRATP